jgi:hypothetical protein
VATDLTERSDRLCDAGIAAAGVAGVLLVLAGTHRYGAGLTSDSLDYIAAARSFARGAGYLATDGRPMVFWPPLFSTVLGIPALAGIDPVASVRYINAVVFGLLILFSGRLITACVNWKPLAVIGALAVLSLGSLLETAVISLSEPLFTLLVVLTVMQLLRWNDAPCIRTVTAAGILAALCCLQRYSGIGIVAAGCLCILSATGVEMIRKLKHATLFAAISLTPLAIWCGRNIAISGTLFGNRIRPASAIGIGSLAYSGRQMADVLSAWLLPGRLAQASVLRGARPSQWLGYGIAYRRAPHYLQIVGRLSLCSSSSRRRMWRL